MRFSKQRVFSNTQNINFNDYMKNKNGIAILKCLKNNNNDTIHQFVSYHEFLTLSQTYNNYLSNDCKLSATQTMYQSNISYKKDCACEKIDNCVQNVLYPYGEYLTNTQINQPFPSKIDLNKWCVNKKICLTLENNCQCFKPTLNVEEELTKPNLIEPLLSTHKRIELNKYPSKKCKTGLCKNARTIFV
jgi:hypothetical protein